jgi:hypothetical protein
LIYLILPLETGIKTAVFKPNQIDRPAIRETATVYFSCNTLRAHDGPRNLTSRPSRDEGNQPAIADREAPTRSYPVRRKRDRGESEGPPNGGPFLFDLEFSYVDREIARLLLEATRPAEMAARLELPVAIIHSHMSDLYQKFKIPSGPSHNRRVQLALRIHEQRAILGIRCRACGEGQPAISISTSMPQISRSHSGM